MEDHAMVRPRFVLPLRLNTVQQRLGIAVALVGGLGCQLSGAAAQAADAGGLAGSGATVAPADAAFFSATLRAREQFDAVVASNAYKAIRALPGVKRALDSLEEQRTMPGSPLAMIETFMQLPENEQAAELLRDMVATDTFVYGEPSCIPLIRLARKLQQAQQTAGAKGLGGSGNGLLGLAGQNHGAGQSGNGVIPRIWQAARALACSSATVAAVKVRCPILRPALACSLP
jgi:hypothetical protein